jgi:hypothetical protein
MGDDEPPDEGAQCALPETVAEDSGAIAPADITAWCATPAVNERMLRVGLRLGCTSYDEAFVRDFYQWNLDFIMEHKLTAETVRLRAEIPVSCFPAHSSTRATPYSPPAALRRADRAFGFRRVWSYSKSSGRHARSASRRRCRFKAALLFSNRSCWKPRSNQNPNRHLSRHPSQRLRLRRRLRARMERRGSLYPSRHPRHPRLCRH